MATVDKTPTLATALDSSSRAEEHTLDKLPLTTHQVLILRLHQRHLLLDRILTARPRQASTRSMVLSTNRARISPMARTNSNRVVSSMVANNTLAQTSSTARISNSQALPTEVLSSSQVRISSTAATRSEPARIFRIPTPFLLHLRGVLLSKANTVNRGSMGNNTSHLLLGNNRSTNRQATATPILRAMEDNSAARLTTILLRHLEDLREDIIPPTPGVKEMSNPLTATSRTTTVARLLSHMVTTLNNNTEDLTEGPLQRRMENLQPKYFSTVVKRIRSLL